MLRLRSTLGALGDCPAGWAAAIPSCPAGYNLETNTQGCQRCTPPNSADQSSQTCIQTLQYFLAQQGSVSYGAATGTWNAETQRALDYRIGTGWRNYPGGACGIVAALQIGDIRAPGSASGFGPGAPGASAFPFTPSSTTSAPISTTTLAIGGAAVLLLILLLRK
jgi:hypothetical protein